MSFGPRALGGFCYYKTKNAKVMIFQLYTPTFIFESQARMEMSWDKNGGSWYLVDTPYHGDLEYVRARIEG